MSEMLDAPAKDPRAELNALREAIEKELAQFDRLHKNVVDNLADMLRCMHRLRGLSSARARMEECDEYIRSA